MSVLLVGFSNAHARAMADLGQNITALFFSEKTAAPPEERIPGCAYVSVGERFGMKDTPFRMSLDVRLADRLREVVYPIFVRCHTREAFRQQSFNNSWLDYNNHFENSLQFYFNVIDSQRIDTVIFVIPPHEGSQIILYGLARALGLRIVMCYQSIFPRAFFLFESLTRFGLSEVASGHGLTMDITEKPQAPFYTRALNKRFGRAEYFRRRLIRDAKVAANYAGLSFLWNPRGFRKSRLKRAYLDSFYSMQNLPDRYYKPFDPAQRYIYFGLHMQPELNTDVFGGKYGDQLLAVEELVRATPDDVEIYFKEHPQQHKHLRDESYFQRLMAIPKARYLRTETSTFELSSNALAIATISGTVGWEALQLGKPVLCLGGAWYRGFPGVFDWRADPAAAVSGALAFRQDRAAFEAAARERAKTLWRGVVNKDFEELLDEYDELRNVREVAASLDQYLRTSAPERSSVERLADDFY